MAATLEPATSLLLGSVLAAARAVSRRGPLAEVSVSSRLTEHFRAAIMTLQGHDGWALFSGRTLSQGCPGLAGFVLALEGLRGIDREIEGLPGVFWVAHLLVGHPDVVLHLSVVR